MDELEKQWAPPRPRRYWNQRHGDLHGRIDLPSACVLFRSTITALLAENLLDEWVGYSCVDGPISGRGGDDPAEFAFRKTRLRGMWPPDSTWEGWDEAHLLTAV